DLEADLGERFAAARQCRLCGPGKGATEHDRAADFPDGDASGLRDSVGHYAVESALPKLAGQQPDGEVLLVLSGATEQGGEDALALDDRAPAGDGANPGKGLIHVFDRQGRGRSGRWRVTQACPADADLALRELTGQVGDHDRRLVRGR